MNYKNFRYTLQKDLKMQKFQTYINNIDKFFQTGNAREYSYRGDLQNLFDEIIDDENIIVTNKCLRDSKWGSVLI